MTVELYKEAALARDLPEEQLHKGDMVIPVDTHRAPDGSLGYSVEIFNALGETLRVTVVPEWALEPLREDEVLCVRPLAAA
jgi:hypothetical protein